MNFAQWKTTHFWLDLAGDAMALTLLVLILTGSHQIIAMGALAGALLLMKKAAVWTAAAWLPATVRGKLSENDLQSVAGKALLALFDRLGLKLDGSTSELVDEVTGEAAAPAPEKVVVTDIAQTTVEVKP